MNDMNSITITGRVGKEPKLAYVGKNDTPLMTFSVAVSKSWKGKDGEWQERTMWIGCKIWRKWAEALYSAMAFGKGAQVTIEGELEEPNVWEDKDGNTHADAQILVKNLVIHTKGTIVDAEEELLEEETQPWA